MKLNTSTLAAPTNYQTCNAGMRIIPRSAFDDEVEVAELMHQISLQQNGCGGFYQVGGASFDNYQMDPTETHVNPMLRKGIFVVNINNHSLNDWWLAKGWTGTSINHQNWDEKNWQENAWGQKNYDELLKKKQLVDPKKLFYCRRCV